MAPWPPAPPRSIEANSTPGQRRAFERGWLLRNDDSNHVRRAGASYLDAVLVIEEVAKCCGVPTGRIVVEAEHGAVGAIMKYGARPRNALPPNLFSLGINRRSASPTRSPSRCDRDRQRAPIAAATDLSSTVRNIGSPVAAYRVCTSCLPASSTSVATRKDWQLYRDPRRDPRLKIGKREPAMASRHSGSGDHL